MGFPSYPTLRCETIGCWSVQSSLGIIRSPSIFQTDVGSVIFWVHNWILKREYLYSKPFVPAQLHVKAAVTHFMLTMDQMTSRNTKRHSYWWISREWTLWSVSMSLSILFSIFGHNSDFILKSIIVDRQLLAEKLLATCYLPASKNKYQTDYVLPAQHQMSDRCS